MSFDTYAQVVKQESLSLTTTVPEFTPGARTSQSGNEYVYVYNGSNSSIGTGKYAVLYNGGSTSLCSGYTVSVTNASLAGWAVGVAQNTFATNTYGWLMSKGIGLIALDSGEVSMNAGVDIALGTDGGFVAAGVTFSTAPRFGFTINSAVTTVGTGKAVFRSLF